MPLGTDLEDTRDSVLNNPWAVHPNVSFTTALRASPSQTRPVVRRRGSDGSMGGLRDSPNGNHHTHSRSRTLEDDKHRKPSHPLARVAGGPKESRDSNGRFSGHDARPFLKRLLSDSEIHLDESSAGESSLGAGTSRVVPRKDERLVLIHQVMPQDSLAGVALKYGISIPDLRRANQLWPSDPIHLRKELYIPIEKARHSRLLQNALIQLNSDPSLLETGQPSDSDGEEVNQDIAQTLRNGLTIIRVPASQLSYFPPPSASIAGAKSHTLPRRFMAARPALTTMFDEESTTSQNPRPLVSSLTPTHSLHSTRSHQHKGFSGLLHAFPVHVLPSARNMFKARQSLDSSSATTSTPSDEYDWEHEMEDVSTLSSVGKVTDGDSFQHWLNTSLGGRRRSLNRGSSDATQDVEMHPASTMTPSPNTPQYRTADTRPASAIITSAVTHRNAPVSGGDSSNGLDSWQPSIRTSQLEPSPIMQLPKTSKVPESG